MAARKDASVAAPELGVQTVAIDAVTAHPDNPRVGDVTAIAESLTRFGQIKPIIVQASSGRIIVGNNTHKAAVSLGSKGIKIDAVDIGDELAKAYMLADNRISDRAAYDSDKLYASLEGLLDLDGTGFDIDFVETLGDALGTTELAGTETGARTIHKEPAAPAAPEADGKPKAPAEPKVEAEPVRDIVMLMTVSRAIAFGEKVKRLTEFYGTSRMVDTVERAVDDAVAKLEADQ